MTTKANRCNGKRKYKTKEHVERISERLLNECEILVTTYKCRHCGHFHLENDFGEQGESTRPLPRRKNGSKG